jgi:hypothetical protein
MDLQRNLIVQNELIKVGRFLDGYLLDKLRSICTHFASRKTVGFEEWRQSVGTPLLEEMLPSTFQYMIVCETRTRPFS